MRSGNRYEKEKVMIRQVNSEAAICMDAVPENAEMRDLSACELDMVSGGFLPGALTAQQLLRIVTGSDGNSYLN